MALPHNEYDDTKRSFANMQPQIAFSNVNYYYYQPGKRTPGVHQVSLWCLVKERDIFQHYIIRIKYEACIMCKVQFHIVELIHLRFKIKIKITGVIKNMK